MSGLFWLQLHLYSLKNINHTLSLAVYEWTDQTWTTDDIIGQFQ